MIHHIISLLLSSEFYIALDPITIGSLVVGLAGNVASQIGSARANRLRQKRLDEQKNEETAWFNKEYYTNELDRSENQAILRALSDKMKEQSARNQATAAITGATPEAQIAQQQNMNRTMANVVNEMAGRASMRKDRISAMHRGAKRDLYSLQDSLDAARQQAWANLGSNATSLAGVGLMYGQGSGAGGNQASGITTENPIASLKDNLQKNTKIARGI